MDDNSDQVLKSKLLSLTESISRHLTVSRRFGGIKETPTDVKKSLCNDLNERGLVQYRLVDFQKAHDDYSEAIKYAGGCDTCRDLLAAAYFNRGTVLYRVSEYSKALCDLKRAVELDPGKQEFKLALAELSSVMEKRCS